MNSFELKKSNQTYYLKYEKKMPYTVSTQSLETEEKVTLIIAILEEFVHSSEAEKKQYQLILEEWLDAKEEQFAPLESHLLEQKSEAVLDNIYEMF